MVIVPTTSKNKLTPLSMGPILIRRNLLSTLTHVSLLVCNWRVLFPPLPRVSKLGNDLAPKGAVRRKEEACSGANVPWCYFAVSENNCATNQEIPGLKSVARCSEAILREHA